MCLICETLSCLRIFDWFPLKLFLCVRVTLIKRRRPLCWHWKMPTPPSWSPISAADGGHMFPPHTSNTLWQSFELIANGSGGSRWTTRRSNRVWRKYSVSFGQATHLFSRTCNMLHGLVWRPWTILASDRAPSRDPYPLPDPSELGSKRH